MQPNTINVSPDNLFIIRPETFQTVRISANAPTKSATNCETQSHTAIAMKLRLSNKSTTHQTTTSVIDKLTCTTS